MLSFNFGGKNSYDDFGILISQRPTLPSPKRRVNYFTIQGRDSSLKFDEETYEDIIITVECSAIDIVSISDKIDDIKDWLFGSGESNLIFSFQSDKKYIAQVVNAIDFKQVLKYTSKFPIVFNCKPYKYSVNNDVIVINENNTVITNPSTLASEPVISVFGTGNIDLNIAGRTVKLYNITDYVVLDTPLLECYRSSDLKNRDMVGNFPELEAGGNSISWIGNVTRLEIIPNFRWL